ncbi:heavy metal-associated isoprenylated plant protein 28-like [Malus sylvestris]|nr:heavy metal-associated isoprenylated plant protein 28-like [Malus sylvestris]
MTIVEMIVTMDCAGCENKIRSSLKKLKGVDAVDVDFNMQKVTVTGWADQEKVLRAVRKTGKRAELWPYPYNPEYHNFGLDYYQQHQPLDLNHHHKHHHNRQITTHHLPITTYISVPKSSSSSYSYNYYEHGSTNQDTGYYQPPPYSTMFNEQDTAVFSDDNPHACSIM